MDRRRFLAAAAAAPLAAAASRTTVAIDGERFLINGKPTYQGRTWEGHKIEGLLMNSRMIQGIFDDENPETVGRWARGGKAYSAERNTAEFVAAMPSWRQHGLLGIVVGLQGGSPEGYSKSQPWRNSAFTPDGGLKPAYMRRMKKIMDRADQLGMVPIVNYFYFGQDQWFTGAPAIERAARNATEWILDGGYRNAIVDVVNESDNRSYDHDALKAPRVHELVALVKSVNKGGRRLLTGTSFNGGSIPTAASVAESDFVIMHGNGVKDPARITAMVETVRKMPEYRPKPILFDEDDHFEFDKPANNMRNAIAAYAGWGYFDPEGYQSMPVDWSIRTERQQAFFQKLRQVTGS